MQALGNATRTKWLLAIFVLACGSYVVADDEKKVDLKQGDLAPVFEGVDDNGNPWKSADFVGKKYIVLYFYPGDFTPGCMVQANKFRDSMNKLTEKDVIVIGVSGDALMTHQLFKKAQKLNFTLLTDEEGSLAQKFGVPVGAGGVVKTKDADGNPVTLTRKATFTRWTFVIGKDGKIASINTKANPATDSKDVAELIEKLEKQ
jgi:thioredoxin-dependent peroxiredoxin